MLPPDHGLLDEWPGSGPSPYISILACRRAGARGTVQTAGSWWAWIRRPALAGAFGFGSVVGITVIERSHERVTEGPIAVVATQVRSW